MILFLNIQSMVIDEFKKIQIKVKKDEVILKKIKTHTNALTVD